MFLQLAMQLARRGLGSADPNPLVGAVLVRDGELVGQGFHAKAGEPHAEIMALRQAGENAAGATLYVNLEPCCHQGRTPPCAPQIVEAGVAAVVVGMVDPDPRVAGGGIRYLREAGLDVTLADSKTQEECILLNRFFVKSVRTGMPFVTLKYAMSLDGKIATHTGHSQWITGNEARERVHRERAEHQAVLVGVKTVLADDCRLNVRLPEPIRQPLRIVLDTQARLPGKAQIIRPPGGRTVVVCGEDAPQRDDVECWRGPAGDLIWLARRLHTEGIRSVFVEGGSAVHGSFLEAGLGTRVLAFVAPRLLGGRTALSPVGGNGAAEVGQGWGLKMFQVERLGDDLLVDGYLDLSWLASGIFEPSSLS